MTNADKIRNMSDEELAEFLYDLSSHCYGCGDFNGCGCYYGNKECQNFTEWLQQEVKQ